MAGKNYGWNIENTENFLDQEKASSFLSPNEDLHRTQPKGHFWYPSTGDIPPGAIKAGVDKDGGDVYVGRAFHAGEIVPAKILANERIACIPWGGEEHTKGDFEILCRGSTTVIWAESSGGAVPGGAVPVGTTSSGERLYLGRVFHDGTLTPGKIQPSHGVCYIPYGGEEISFSTYEVLILQ